MVETVRWFDLINWDEMKIVKKPEEKTCDNCENLTLHSPTEQFCSIAMCECAKDVLYMVKNPETDERYIINYPRAKEKFGKRRLRYRDCPLWKKKNSSKTKE